MAHIITYMDEVLGSGLHGFATEKVRGSKQRNAVVPRHRETGRPLITAENAPVNHAEVRMDRVQALRAAIADGSYNVSASDLADKILHSMLSK